MPMGAPRRLSLLTFPQTWDGNSLVVRFLCLPKGNPQDPLRPGLPSFADANLIFEAKLIASLDRLPLAADVTEVRPVALDEPPTQKPDLFTELTRQFKIKPLVKRVRPQATFRKVMTESYRALIGDRRHSSLLSDAAEFECALHQGATDQPDDPAPPSDELTWGQLMAFALRQPKLASALGLVGQVTVTPVDPAIFASGGWVYIDLDPASDYANEADFLARYAARIPKLTIKRSIFAAVLFPVTDAPTDFIADDVAREARIYEDGIAKQVHCTQGTDGGDSIQLAWDDEQIAEWLHRQVQVTPAGELEIDAPNGVSGYRVDVREAGDDAWNSLLRIESRGDLKLDQFSLGSFQGEGIVEVAPAQISPKQDAQYWLPSYFATWRGSSLAMTDADLAKLHARPGVRTAETPPHLLDREKIFIPVDDHAVLLRYGHTYEFRVRLADLTRGGPEADVPEPDPARNSVASITFQRRRAPRQIEILKLPSPASRQVLIAKPKLGYPEALFTNRAVFSDLEDDLDQLAANPKPVTREVGVPDPDVLTVEIQVQVKTLDGDALPGKDPAGKTAGYFELYRTTRSFGAAELAIDLDFQDHSSLVTLSANQPDNGSLVLPTARDLRLTFVPIGRDQPGYFADENFRRGAPLNLDLRANATEEPDLLAEPLAFSSIRSFFFQPPPAGNTLPPPAERLATEIGLDQNALTLAGRPGRRTVIACAAELRHTLSPESSAITFSSSADLVHRWINVVQFQVARDWTWDGLDGAGIRVTRVVHFAEGPDSVELAGVIRLPRVIGTKSVRGVPADPRAAVRQSTDLIFFDAFDPKPKRPLPEPPAVEPPPLPFPSEITVDYVFEPAFLALPPGDLVRRSVLLPITTPPSQVPRILSAGIALSNYEAVGDYSSTAQRRRMLWFQFLEMPEDPQDAYYVRVLAVGPDAAMLDRDMILPDKTETPLPIDPEWMRLIMPGQPRDENGLSAMQRLEDSPTGEGHYLVPLPPDLQESSPELFGFFVYEVRLGHTASRWSTAQGRFGPALRIAGVQHPPPPLVCQAARSKTQILVRAPFATPVLDGANLRPGGQETDLWAVLYARVQQTDGAAWRNVMLARTELFPPQAGDDPERLGVPVLFGEAVFEGSTVVNMLRRMGLPDDQPLTVLAAEVFAHPREQDPFGEQVGHARMLRISPLVSVPSAC